MNPIEFAIRATLFELQDDPSLRHRVREKHLRTAAWTRLKEAGFLVECSRCGGTGKAGPVNVYGGTCFKCGGSRYMIHRYTEKWRQEVLAYDWREHMRRAREKKNPPA